MERLTLNNERLGFIDSNKLPSYEGIYERLKRYEDLEEKGKLIKLPCNVGDTVFVKMYCGYLAEAEVRDFSYFLTCGFCAVVTSTAFDKQHIPFLEFGKTVFLTQKEAEEVKE